MTATSGWGRYPIIDTQMIHPHTVDPAQSATTRGNQAVARGNGRAYGDAGIGVRQTISMIYLNRMRTFDAQTGLITIEAGVLLSDLIETFLPRGFLPYALPGTSFITVGGDRRRRPWQEPPPRGWFRSIRRKPAIGGAHRGNASCIARRTLRSIFRYDWGNGTDWHNSEATIRLRRVETGWIRQRTIVAEDLSAAIAALENSDSATYSVAWIDCLAKGARLGRSLIFLGRTCVLCGTR